MESPRVLFIAPNSYPPINSEANVNAKLIKVLTDAGYIIDLVCRISKRDIYQKDDKSSFLFDKINSINIVDVNQAYNFDTIVRHVKTFFKMGTVYKGADWAFNAACKCDELIRQNSYDYIYTYDSPSEIVGLYVTKKYKIRWIATWNDPYMWVKYPVPYGGGVSMKISYFRKKLIEKIGKHAFWNIFPSDRLRDYMLRYMTNMKIDSCMIAPHILLNELEQPNDKQLGKTLKIIHAGALGKERNPNTTIYGLRKFLDKFPDAAIECAFLGVFENSESGFFTKLVCENKLESYITQMSPVSYIESLDVIKQYDVCLVIEADLEEGIFLPGKIVDYLQSSKPILAISPCNGVLNDEYQEGIIDYFANIKDAESIALEFEKVYQSFKNGTLHAIKKDCTKYRNESILKIHHKLLID